MKKENTFKESPLGRVLDYLYGIIDELINGPGFKAILDLLRKPVGILGLIFLAISIIIPFIPGTGYYMEILWFVFFYIAVSESWNIIGGYGGEVDFGHVVFVGIGAYTVGLLYNAYYVNIWIGVIIGGFIAAIFAVLLGIPTLRLRGAYFAVTMLAVNEAVKNIFLNTPQFGSGQGIYIGQVLSEIPGIELLNYYAIIILTIFAFLTTHYISYSRLGLSLRAIKESIPGSCASGVEVTQSKLIAFAISAFIAGMAGGLLMINFYQITPGEAFRGETTVEMIIMTLLGGAGNVFGPVLGALILVPLKQFLIALFAGQTLVLFGLKLKLELMYLVVYGIIFILVVLFIPKGIMGYLEEKKIVERESLAKYSLRRETK